MDRDRSSRFPRDLTCDAQRPIASNVKYERAAHAASNHDTVRTDNDAKVCVFTSAATHTVIDIDIDIDIEGIYRNAAN